MQNTDYQLYQDHASMPHSCKRIEATVTTAAFFTIIGVIRMNKMYRSTVLMVGLMVMRTQSLLLMTKTEVGSEAIFIKHSRGNITLLQFSDSLGPDTLFYTDMIGFTTQLLTAKIVLGTRLSDQRPSC